MEDSIMAEAAAVADDADDDVVADCVPVVEPAPSTTTTATSISSHIHKNNKNNNSTSPSHCQRQQEQQKHSEVIDFGDVTKDEQKRRLLILKQFVQGRKQVLSNEVVSGEVGTVPLFTDFLNISYHHQQEEQDEEGESKKKKQKLMDQDEPKMDEDDDDDEVKVVDPPRRIYIDVDVELGLKPRTTKTRNNSNGSNHVKENGAAPTVDDNNNNNSSTRPDTARSSTRIAAARSAATATAAAQAAATASSAAQSAATATVTAATADQQQQQSSTSSSVLQRLSPEEEGYYEGVVSPMSLPEDAQYLSEIQCWTRQNLQLFSATPRDIQQFSGRRGASSMVWGKIGIRCRHCAAAAEIAAATSDALAPNDDTTITSTTSKATVVGPTNKTARTSRFVWPPAAVSYPFNMNGIYSVCAQKPTLHFNHCPYLPKEEKSKLQLLAKDQNTNTTSASGAAAAAAASYKDPSPRLTQSQQASRQSPRLAQSQPAPRKISNREIQQEPSASRQSPQSTRLLGSNKRSRSSIPTSTYYAIAAKRIGIVDVEDGMRFGRDLTLKPLPLETVHAQLQEEERRDNELRGLSATNELNAGIAMAGRPPSLLLSSSLYGSSSAAAAAQFGQPLVRLSGDEASEQVLAEAVAEADDPKKQLLARSTDKSMISDYIFLILRQMVLCHAVPHDFSSRGKKTKFLRLGLAGFSCRHCSSSSNTSGNGSIIPGAGESSRSFCSAPDNLSSAVTNSFVAHLSKCQAVPVRMKKALAAYRRIHPKQMSQLPYGSQRRMFHEIWARLRACDKTEAEMETIVAATLQNNNDDNNNTTTTVPPEPLPTTTDPLLSTKETMEGNATAATPLSSTPPLPTEIPPSELDRLSSFGGSSPTAATTTTTMGGGGVHVTMNRSPDFPVSTVPETVAMLQTLMDEWDPATNDFLFLPEDRNLVSDYVFLTMRQLKVSLPSLSDATRMRRGPAVMPTFPGVCCIHCRNENDTVTPSGRSFPSAPDNFASALNSSLYNHMQACPFVPANLKRILADVRKWHSAQCSSLKFGSQRRYFNRLFDRLKKSQGSGVEPSKIQVDAATELFEYGFLQLPSSLAPTLFVCRKCNMIPMQFRAVGAVHTERPSRARARDHQRVCRGGKLNLQLLVETFRAAAAATSSSLPSLENNNDPMKLLSLESFQRLLQLAAGSSELCHALTEGMQKILNHTTTTTTTTTATTTTTNSNKNGAQTQHTNKPDDDVYYTDRSDLWRLFFLSNQANNYQEVKDAFSTVASELKLSSANMEDHPNFLTFLLMVNPGLELVEDKEEEDQDKMSSSLDQQSEENSQMIWL